MPGTWSLIWDFRVVNLNENMLYLNFMKGCGKVSNTSSGLWLKSDLLVWFMVIQQLAQI